MLSARELNVKICSAVFGYVIPAGSKKLQQPVLALRDHCLVHFLSNMPICFPSFHCILRIFMLQATYLTNKLLYSYVNPLEHNHYCLYTTVLLSNYHITVVCLLSIVQHRGSVKIYMKSWWLSVMCKYMLCE